MRVLHFRLETANYIGVKLMNSLTENTIRRLKYISNLTAINSIISFVLAMSFLFFYSFVIINVNSVSLSIVPYKTANLPVWIFLLFVVDYFLLLSLWGNFYKLSSFGYYYKIVNLHLAVMVIGIVGLNQAMVYTALNNHTISVNSVGKANLFFAAYTAIYFLCSPLINRLATKEAINA